MQMPEWQSVQKKKKKDLNSAPARVHPLRTPRTPYYSFPGITGGFWPYFQRSKDLSEAWSVKAASSVSTSAPSKGVPNPHGHEKPHRGQDGV